MKKKQKDTYIRLIFGVIITYSCCFTDQLLCRKFTLPFFERYAQQVPEIPPCDDLNWINPNYSSFQKSLTSNKVTRFLQKLHIWPQLEITPEIFKEILTKVKDKRKSIKLDEKVITTLTCLPESHFFIWGNLQGAYHSLVRDLRYLVSQGIIDESLILQNKNHYFIFNGDAIGRSAYSLETLTVILALMNQNPDKVFYTKGMQEKDKYWHNFGLKRQLQIRAYYLSDDPIPLANDVDGFFNTLPDIIYLTTPENSKKAILLYFSGIQSLTDTFINPAYIPKDAPLGVERYNPQPDGAGVDSDIQIAAIIRSENWIKENRTLSGLGLLDQSYGITNWAINSAPTELNRVYYDFFNDAFVELALAPNIDHSTLTLYNRSVETTDPFEKQIPVNIVTGRPTTMNPSIPTGDDILLGSTVSLTQGIPIVGERIKQGISLAVNAQNRKGGINGRHIRLDIRDDAYMPSLAKQNIISFMKKNTRMIIAPLGDGTLAAYKEYVENKDIIVLFPVAGGPQFRNQKYKGIAHIAASYADGVTEMVNHVIDEHATTHFAFFYQNDDYGIGPVTAAHNALKARGITKWINIPYTRGQINFSKEAELLKQAQVGAIGFFSTSHATQEFIRQVQLESINNKALFGAFLLGDASFKNFVSTHGLSIMLGSRVPNPYISTFPVIQEYRDVFKKHYYPYSVFSLEAYIATRLTITLLNSLKGEITKDSLMDAIEALKDFEFGGFTYTFDPQSRSVARRIWLTTDDKHPWMERQILKSQDILTQESLTQFSKSGQEATTINNPISADNTK